MKDLAQSEIQNFNQENLEREAHLAKVKAELKDKLLKEKEEKMEASLERRKRE